MRAPVRAARPRPLTPLRAQCGHRGFLGGTFNPPHLAHLVCAQEAHLQLELDSVLLVPARVPPHKPVDEEPGIDHRLELCRLAIHGDDRFAVSDIEARRAGPSFTVDTLEELHFQMPDSELFLIVGADIAVGFPEWQAPDRVLSLSTLAVAQARRHRAAPRSEEALERVPERRALSRFFDMPEIGISSTMLRQRVQCQQASRPGILMPRRCARLHRSGTTSTAGIHVDDAGDQPEVHPRGAGRGRPIRRVDRKGARESSSWTVRGMIGYTDATS